MKIVIDFSGYYLKSQFIIREFSLCQMKHLTVTSEPTIITDDPTTSISSRPQNKSYKKFIDKVGITKAHNSYPLHRLRQKLKSIIDRNSIIYVRNGQQFSKLISFINDNKYQSDKIKLLSDLGFDDSHELTETNCPHHINKSNNYCAHDNAKLMMNWLRKRKLDKLKLLNKMQVVINFSGYYDYKNEFTIKELSIVGLSNDGKTIYHKLYVTKPVYHSNNFINDINKKKYDNYYNNFGIRYEDGNYESKCIIIKILEILFHYDIKIIYVKNYYYRYLLSKVVNNIKIYDFICLEDYNYVETYDISTNCEYHKHEDNSKNICVNNSAVNMVNWILTNEFYKSEVRNRFADITLDDDVNIDENDDIDDEMVNQFIINDNDELPLITSDDLKFS
ncbi:uncharacterized protein LOC130675014 [Microplitis mediator]|uniref:uncharacterized protein LOC130675014 n=1 Tax=Microplitis mediator TaxID=375433 RepID=UPI0025537864|nr:uncharacterized protein LOC130675014 [Microplitis mediator]